MYLSVSAYRAKERSSSRRRIKADYSHATEMIARRMFAGGPAAAVTVGGRHRVPRMNLKAIYSKERLLVPTA